MDTDSVVLFIKADYIYKDIAGDLETRFDTSNYELDRKFLMKDELGRKILTKFVGLKVTIYNYLKDGKVKRKKQMYHKTKNLNVKILKTFQKQISLRIGNHKQFIRNNKSISKTQQIFKNENRNVFSEEINNIALSSNDDKGMQ